MPEHSEVHPPAELRAERTRPENQWKRGELIQAWDRGGLLEYTVEQLGSLYDRIRRMGRKTIEHSSGEG